MIILHPHPSPKSAINKGTLIQGRGLTTTKKSSCQRGKIEYRKYYLDLQTCDLLLEPYTKDITWILLI